MAMITDIEEYFAKGCGRCERFATVDCSTRAWVVGLAELRRICVAVGLVETVKWGHPCYVHSGRNIAIIGAFRGDFRLSFFHPSLLRDADGVLEKQGPNTQHADAIRFSDNDQVSAMAPVITAYLEEAMGYAAAGITPPKEERAIELPDELVEAMAADAELSEAFHALTPGRQRGYVIHLNSAKQSATRIWRIAKCRDKILAGKGFNER